MGINKLSRLLSELGIHDDVVKILNENDVSGSLLLFFMMGGNNSSSHTVDSSSIKHATRSTTITSTSIILHTPTTL